MTDIDPELRDKLIQTHTDMRWVRDKLESGAETFKDHDERLRDLEQNRNKIAGIVIAVGAGIALAMNGVLWLLGKVWK